MRRASVVLDAADGELLVANDKGLGATGFGVVPPPTNTAENSYATYYGVSDFEHPRGPRHREHRSHSEQLDADGDDGSRSTENNHWDLAENIQSASGGKPNATPVAIPAKIGAPSLIKHVFVIIRENRTYDQILGDVAGGNGDATLAVFGDGTAAPATPHRSRRTRTRWCSASRFWTTSTTRAASRPTVTTGSSRPWLLTPTTSSRQTGSAITPPTAAMRLPTRRSATCGTQAVKAGVLV